MAEYAEFSGQHRRLLAALLLIAMPGLLPAVPNAAGMEEPATKAWLVDRCFLGFLYDINEDAAHVDSGTAGPGIVDVDGAYVTERQSVSGVTVDQALSALPLWQRREYLLCAKEWIFIDIEALNLSGGVGTVWKEHQWNQYIPSPVGPANTNHKVTVFTDDKGGMIYLVWGCTGRWGVFGNRNLSPIYPGGTGQQLCIYMAPNGDKSYTHFVLHGTHYDFAEYHLELSLPIDPDVEITGPDEIDEDTPTTWKAKLDEDCLPADSYLAWDFEWNGPPRYRWSAPDGLPTSGTGDTFETKYLEPGEYEWKVEAERDYTYKRRIAVKNPSWDMSQPLHLAFRPGVGSVDATVRTTVFRHGPIHDITPPDLKFTIKTEEGLNGIELVELPEDKEPPKTYRLSVSGVNFLPDIGTSFALTVDDVPVAPLVRLDSSVSPSLQGFFEKEDRRFFLAASSSDNYSPDDALHPQWTITNETKGSILLQKADIPFSIIRYNNEETMEEMLLTATVADEAGNTTRLVIPLTVFKVVLGVSHLDFSGEKRR